MSKLIQEFEKYKAGSGEAPVIYRKANYAVDSGELKVILTLEEVDRDGEVVEVNGIKFTDPEMGVPLIDSHKMHDSVTVNGLGAIRNLRKEVIGGKMALVGDPDFAPTPNGEIAKVLYLGVNGGKPYFTNVSIGFRVTDYDNETKFIKQSELFEVSLVTVGANRGARFTAKSMKVEDDQIAKDLARFAQIKSPFKTFTKLFLSDTFCKALGVEKSGDLSSDIEKMYAILSKEVVQKTEAPQIVQKSVAPMEQQPQAVDVDRAIIEQIIAKLS